MDSMSGVSHMRTPVTSDKCGPETTLCSSEIYSSILEYTCCGDGRVFVYRIGVRTVEDSVLAYNLILLL
jgi:hypothetical protein